jgi:hypothetical protein
MDIRPIVSAAQMARGAAAAKLGGVSSFSTNTDS